MTNTDLSPPGTIYIHVPKCGGSSFGAALRLRYLWSQATIPLGLGDPSLSGSARIQSDYQARAARLRHLVACGTRMIAGHVCYDQSLHSLSGYRHITLLRDPVARFISHYAYLQRRHPNPTRPDTLAAFLDSSDAQRIASQYLFHFAGQSQDTCTDLPSAISQAQAALARFDLVGDLEMSHTFARGLRQLTGTPIPIMRRNRAPQPIQVPAALYPQIKTLCAADIAIYRSALGLPEAA